MTPDVCLILSNIESLKLKAKPYPISFFPLQNALMCVQLTLILTMTEIRELSTETSPS